MIQKYATTQVAQILNCLTLKFLVSGTQNDSVEKCSVKSPPKYKLFSRFQILFLLLNCMAKEHNISFKKEILWQNAQFPAVQILARRIEFESTSYKFRKLRLLWWLSQQRICLQYRKPGFDPWVRKNSGEGNGYTLQYSCLYNPVDRETWWATVHGITRVDMT